MFRTLLIAGACLLSVPAFAQKYTAQLSGGEEVPPHSDATGTGMATVTLNGDTITYEVDYKGLSGPATAGHIHGPAEAGANAGVEVPFKDVSSSPIKGTATLTAAQVADLKAGKTYVNLHTEKNKGGEIRGQLKPAS